MSCERARDRQQLKDSVLARSSPDEFPFGGIAQATAGPTVMRASAKSSGKRQALHRQAYYGNSRLIKSCSVDQGAVINFLSHPESYGLCKGEVKRIDTHCSVVFLAADRAYKLKRAIRYGDADYTVLAKRRAACASELVVNRRTAPQLYLGVYTICRGPDGTPAFGGSGPLLDYVVVMRRFAQEDLFDHLAETGQLTSNLMQTLGRIIAQFHKRAARRPQHGGGIALQRVIAEHVRALSRHVDLLGEVELAQLNRRLHAALARATPQLNRRRHAGKIRRCHGDLRLANICLWRGRPTLFDAVEFSEAVGSIDVLYDLAFLLMDLCVFGLRASAKALFDAYLKFFPEHEGIMVLPLFLALRASMRTLALADSAQRQPGSTQATKKRAQAQQHLRAAIDFLAPNYEGRRALH